MTATERTLASSVTSTLLSIGELSERTGVPTTALRYYDELGLVRPAARAAGRRRYAASAVRDVGVILFFREIGFSLAEIGRFIAGERRSRREMIDHKLPSWPNSSTASRWPAPHSSTVSNAQPASP